MKIDSYVLIKTLNESPRFREDLIRLKAENDHENLIDIITFLNLKLVNEIYVLGINRRTYNSSRRRALKKEEITFIHCYQIYGVLGKN